MILIRKLLGLLGLDKSILWASSGRLVPMLFGPVGSIIVVFTLSPKEQGTYYLFLSLIALKSFFDLGASAAIAQMTPHLMKRDSEGASLAQDIDPEFIQVATGLIRKLATAFGLGCGIIGVGYLIWSGEKSSITILMWLCTVGATAMGGSIEGHTQIVYGSGHVDEVSKMRLVGACIQYLIQWTLLLCGASLFSFAASIFAVFLWQYGFLRKRHPYVFAKATPTSARRAEIRSELGALVKRASLTYISGFLVFQIQQPIIFKYLGADESAKLGFTGMIGGTLIGIASMWSLTSFPRFAKQVASGKIDSAFIDFKKTWWRTLAIASGGFVLAILALATLRQIPRFEVRLMSYAAAVPLFAAVWIQQVASVATYWPRSFKTEPFAPIALIQMVITPVAVFFLVSHFGLMGVGLANTTSWLIGAAGIVWIARKFFPARMIAKPV